MAGETDYVKATKVQGSSFNVGDKVVYKGREMVVSQGKDSDGDMKMVDMSGVKALADSLAANSSLTSVRRTPGCQASLHTPLPLHATHNLASAECLPHDHSCLQLDLSENDLGPEGATALAPGLVKGSLTSLE